METSRHTDWPERLNRYIVENRDKEFAWGKHDCVIFVAGAIKAMTGVDHMEEFRGKYNSEETAKKALDQIGSGSLYHTLRSKFGDPVPGAWGKRGDIAYHDLAVGLVIGRSAIFVGQNGYVLMPITQLKKVFRVG